MKIGGVASLALLTAVATGCPGPRPPPGESVQVPSDLAKKIVEATGPGEAVEATMSALAAGGVQVADGATVLHAASYPPASWTVDPQIAFNLAAEAHDRAVSGRLTVESLGRLLRDMGFPFNGRGTPGEQLMAFLRAWVVDAQKEPGTAAAFTPLFLGEMARRQVPAVDLSAVNAPEALRLSLLEVELLIAAFDRVVQPGAPARSSGTVGMREAAISDSACTNFKKVLGSIGFKAGQMGLGYVKGFLKDNNLRQLGYSEQDIESFNTIFGRVMSAFDALMKIIKLVQVYANTEVTVTIEGQNPVHKPTKTDPRLLVPFTARAGIPDAAWQDYQQNGSQTFRDVKSCLEFLGIPAPYDLKDIGDKVKDWRVGWEFVSGSPAHAFLSKDVNLFDGADASHPFGMKLVSDGPVSGKATLKVDIREESPFATLFKGPETQADVTVRAAVLTNVMPDPVLLANALSWLGTLSAVLDLSAGWVQTLLPSTSTATIKVIYRKPPDVLTASVELQVRFKVDNSTSTLPMAVTGNVTHALQYHHESVGQHPAVEFYKGEGNFNYTSLLVVEPPNPPCTDSWEPISGIVVGYVGPPADSNGNLDFDAAPSFTESTVLPRGAREKLTHSCPLQPPFSFETTGGIATAITIHYDNQPSMAKVPMMSLSDWTFKPDGSLEKRFTGPRQFVAGGHTWPILDDDTTFTLTPIFSTP